MHILFFKNDGARETQRRESAQGCLRKHTSIEEKMRSEDVRITVHPRWRCALSASSY